MNICEYNTIITSGQLAGGAAAPHAYDDARLNGDLRRWYRRERVWNCDPALKERKRRSLGALLERLLRPGERPLRAARTARRA